MKKDHRFGSAPINGHYGRIIFTDPQREEEWNNLPDSVKRFAEKHLNYTASKMTNQLAIEMLCDVINDLMARIETLERRENVDKD